MTKRMLVKVLSVILILVGLLGFVMDPVLGIFGVDLIHNLIHLGSGALGLYLASQGEGGAATFGKVMAVIYGLVTILGFMTPMGMIEPEGQVIGLISMNGADNYLHLALTAVFAYIGFSGNKATV